MAAITDAGLVATPLKEWVVTWPSSRQLRADLLKSTLYVTMEPSAEGKGEAFPPMTQLIEQSGIRNVVIGCADPVLEKATEGAAHLHSLGISVTMGIEQKECENLIASYAERANSKLQKIARMHLKKQGLVSCNSKEYGPPTTSVLTAPVAPWIPSLQCREFRQH